MLSDFDIKSSSQKSVKGQAKVDMLAENSQNIASPEEQLDDYILTLTDDKWTMCFDNASNLSRSRTRAVLIPQMANTIGYLQN